MASKDQIGRYPVYAKDWSRTGEFSDTPTYAGQQPQRFPSDWTPFQCAIAAHLERLHGE